MSLSSYLASKYLTAEPSSSGKKRKRKDKSSASSGLIIADDDALGWTNDCSHDISKEHDSPITVNSGSAEFCKPKKNGWKIFGSLSGLSAQDAEAAEAEKIIAQTAAENFAIQKDEEEPAIYDDGITKMGDGTHAGLQSASAVRQQFARRQREEGASWEDEEQRRGRKNGASWKDEETVYRDATGRRIDLVMRRQEAQREANAQAKKEREEMEAQRGDVQKAARTKYKEELDEARFMPVARMADDEELNCELKQRDRWNDPAAQFVKKSKGRKSVSGRPLYMGPAAPNRYGIRPGHRWDGVDRGNGWEGERFKALNRIARNRDLDYSWQIDE